MEEVGEGGPGRLHPFRSRSPTCLEHGQAAAHSRASLETAGHQGCWLFLAMPSRGQHIQ